MKVWHWALLCVLVGLIGGAAGYALKSKPRGEPVLLLEQPTAAPLMVDISGAVAAPGMYALTPGARVSDAIEAAGGLIGDAEPDNLNLAARLQDGQKLIIPDSAAGLTQRSLEIPVQPGSAKININTATQAMLEELPGIGAAKAQQIIAYREKNGWFTSIEAIMNVPGIGQGIFDTIKDLIQVAP